MKEKRKLRDKMALNMIKPGDALEVTNDMELFNLKQIKKKYQLEEVGNNAQTPQIDSDASDSEEEIKANKVLYDRYDEMNYEDDDDEFGDVEEGDEIDSDEESEEENEESSDDDEDDKLHKNNPLLVDLENRDAIQSRKTDMWFNKDVFSGMDIDADEDVEISKMVADYKKRGGDVEEPSIKTGKKRKHQASMEVDEESDSGHGSDSDDLSDSDLEGEISDSDSDYNVHKAVTAQERSDRPKKTISNKNGFDIVPATEPARKMIKLDPVELALGEELIKSKKRRRELIEDSYNRYTFNDENLPDWFVKDEAQHTRRQLPVTKEQVRAYKEKMKAINARAPKKVIEAKARKKRKAMKKMERARKKAEAITDNAETTDREKWSQIKQIYKKAGLLSKKKRELTYVVAKKGAGKKVSRPAGVKGQFKVVDARMKKDIRKQKAMNKKGGKGSRAKPRKR